MPTHTPVRGLTRPLLLLLALGLAALLAGCTSLPGRVSGAAAPAATASGAAATASGSSGTASGAAATTSGAGSTATPAPAASAKAQAGSSGDILRATLSNGLEVVIVRDALAPVATQEITYFVGGNQSPPGFPGTAHAQEHMMFRGSPGLTGDQLSEISALLGGSSNAYTSANTTTYYFTVPADDLDLTLKVGALRMAGVDDSAADWETERGAIEQEVARDNSDPLYVLQAKAREHIFSGTPYADTGLGTKPSFDKTTAGMLKQFHNTWYAPNNALLVVAGDVNPQDVLEKVKQLYGSIPSKKIPEKKKITLSPVSPDSFTSETDQPYGMVAYVFRMPGYRDPDYPTAELLGAVLDSRRGKIADLTYNGQALASGFSYNALKDTGFAYAWAAFPPGADAKTISSQLKNALEQSIAGLPPDLVAAQKRKALLANALRRNSVHGLAQAWTDAIALEGIDAPERSAERLQKVEAGAVDKAARDYLDFSHAVTLQLTPSPGARPQSGGEVFGTPESFGKTPQKQVELPAWAQAALAKLPSPKPLFKPEDFTLANGIRLIVQPIARSSAVSLFGSVHTNEDFQAPPGKEGVGSMLDSLYEWGPAGMTRTEFETKMDDIGADYSVGSGFSLQVLPDYLEAGVKLISEDLLKPALPTDAFTSQQNIYAQQLAGRSKSPNFQFQRKIQTALLPADDPSLRMPTAESVRSLTMSDIRDYEAKVMRPDETTIVVMGDVNPQRVKSLIEKYFGSWKAEGPKPKLVYGPVPPSQATHVFVPDQFRQQDQVILAETVDSNYEDPDHYALSLGNGFLGGETFASPLYRELRVNRGLVYSVGSSVGFGRHRASFQISYGAYPDKVQEAKQIALEQLKSMASTPLTPVQLHLAKAQALRKIELTNQSLGDVAGSWLGYAEEGLELDRLYLVAHRYEQATAAEVQAAFKKYIDPQRLSTFILGKSGGQAGQ